MNLTFKQYISEDSENLIFEGGNVQINGEEAGTIDLEIHDRKDVTKRIKRSLSKLNDAFKLQNGLYLWKPQVLTDNLIFSGSTKHLFDEAIADDHLKDHKSKFGDIDTMIDETLKKTLKEFLEKHNSEKFGDLELIGTKTTGGQIITLWKFEKYKTNIQIDFEDVEFTAEGEPTEWSHFSHSSPFEDLTSGIKGVFHKLLLGSLMAPKKVDAVEQLKTKQKEIIAGTHTLSVKGMREKYKVIGKHESGKPLVMATNSTEYIRNFIEIFYEVFGKYPEPKPDVKKFWSFKGLIELIQDYMERNQIEDVRESFIEKLYGKGAQSLYRNDNERDAEEKQIALDYLSDELKIDTDTDELRINDLKKVYYKKKK